MKITIHDIAKEVGISIGAVSRALKDDTRISAETRQKVRSAVERMGYTPNSIGRGLRTGKSSLVGFLVSSIDDSFYNDILEGIGKEVCNRGYGLLTGITKNNSNVEIDQIKLFVSKNVEGIIVSGYQDKTAGFLRTLHKEGLAMVVCDFESLSSSIPSVIIDESLAAGMICQHLIGFGHRNFIYCFENNKNSLDRYYECSEYLLKCGIEKPVLCRDICQLSEIMKANKQRPTAAICYSDIIAVDVIHIMREMGLSIPGDISVTGFDDMFFASWPSYNLTTIYQPKVEIGMYAAETLFKILDNNEHVSDVLITPELIIRTSTGTVNI